MSDAVLEARQVCAGYHGHPFVRDLDMEVRAGEVVALIGPNGAGKTTTLLTLAGELTPLNGEIYLGGLLRRDSLDARARDRLGFVTEERSVFMTLTVAENLRVGRVDVKDAIGYFPELERLLGRSAGLLSGGEQQMLTLARAFARQPRVLLIDELSLGLAPLMVNRLLAAVRQIATDKQIGVLIVEQKVEAALSVSDRGYVMRDGEIVLSGASTEIAGRVRELEGSYLASRTQGRRDSGT
jgi:branched-chain amino acid transport system ATP-binding protein